MPFSSSRLWRASSHPRRMKRPCCSLWHRWCCCISSGLPCRPWWSSGSAKGRWLAQGRPNMRMRFWMRGVLCAGALVLAAAGGCGSNQTPAKTQAAAPPAPAASAGTFQAVDAAPPPEKTGGFDGQRAFEHVRKLVEIGPRPPASEGIQKAQGYIEAQLKRFDCKWEADNFAASTPIGQVQMKNILVKIPGKSRDVILLTTHYDTLMKPNFVGADDGGSSTGLMLEMARLLCGRKNALGIWIAFFDGEEAFRQWDKDTDSTFGTRQIEPKLSTTHDFKRIKPMSL